eukprot:TRINITY_DN13225_c0_g1_i1.p1 TRINITY_DN13225_c0_g1~~TRINITY_DN13225_c0_g1_i1.p1  ORF type:complete len:2011 (-),score=426.78 TRINITY_DN13225_c0_g1_i1:51-5642(-)
MPKEGCPQLLLRISIEDDVSNTLQQLPRSSITGRNSVDASGFGLSPVPRHLVVPGGGTSGGGTSATDIVRDAGHDGTDGGDGGSRVETLRRSVDCLQAELANAKAQLDQSHGRDGGEARGDFSSFGGVASRAKSPSAFAGVASRAKSPSAFAGVASRAKSPSAFAGVASRARSPVPFQSDTVPVSGRPSIAMDNTVREKELQAAKIKQRVAEMASAQRRAQDTSRGLQDNTRKLQDLRRQLQSLEIQIVEQRAATQILERDREQLLAEEAQDREQIAQRDATLEELRTVTDEIDRELSRALGERERQRSTIEQSRSNFHSQTQHMVSDIDQSKRHVAKLAETVESKEEMVRNVEMEVNDEEQAKLMKQALDREEMRNQLDRTRGDLEDARRNLEENERQRQSTSAAYQDVRMRLAGIESELAEIGPTGPGTAGDEKTGTALSTKREKLDHQTAHVRNLEVQLQQNRDAIFAMQGKMTEMHSEAQEKELTVRRLEDQRVELIRKVEVQRHSASACAASKLTAEGNIARAARELEQSRRSVEDLENTLSVESLHHAKESANLQKSVDEREAELRDARSKLEELSQSCEGLDATANHRRRAAQERSKAIIEARARVERLEKELSQAAGESTDCEALLRRLRQDVEGNSTLLSDLQQQKTQRKAAVSSAHESRQKTLLASGATMTGLEKTVAVIRCDVDGEKRATAEVALRCANLERSVAETRQELAEADSQLHPLEDKQGRTTSELDSLAEELEAESDQLQQHLAEVATQAAAASTRRMELDSTRVRLDEKLRGVSELETEHRKELERLEAVAEEVVSEHEASRDQQAKLRAELEVAKTEHAIDVDDLSKMERKQSTLGAELDSLLLERTRCVGEGDLTLVHHGSRAREAQELARLRSERASVADRKLRRVKADQTALNSRLSSIREVADEKESDLVMTRVDLKSKMATHAEVEEQLSKQEASASAVASECAELGRMRGELIERLTSEKAIVARMPEFEKRHAELMQERRTEQEVHQRELEQRVVDMTSLQVDMQRQRKDILSRKAVEIDQNSMQMSLLELERSGLVQVATAIDREHKSLEGVLSEQERENGIIDAKSLQIARDCEAIEQAIRECRGAIPQLDLLESKHNVNAASADSRAASLRNKVVEMREVMEKARRSGSDAEVEQELSVWTEKLRVAQDTHASFSKRQADLHKELEGLVSDEESSKLERAALEVAMPQVVEAVKKARAKLNAVTVETEKQQQTILQRARRVKQYVNSRDQGSIKPGQHGVYGKVKEVQELEEALGDVSDRLAETLELVRRFRAQEEESRAEVSRLKDTIRAAQDKLGHQAEHANIQFETISKLDEQKQRSDGEVEVLTLGLHDVEQRNSFLEKENFLMQQQVEGHYKGSLQDWAAEVQRVKVAAEVAHFKEEIEIWKHKAEHLRHQKQIELGRMQKEHEATVQGLRDRVDALQREVSSSEDMARMHELAALKRQQLGDVGAVAPSNVVLGLAVPQRPLPTNHNRRKALLIGSNYMSSHAPLKGCVNDVWSFQCLLRHTLRYKEDQIRVLVDGDISRERAELIPTKANILAGLQWLVSGAMPGDSLLLFFAGYGAQHPRSPNDPDQYEAYFVPSDFAADLPADFFAHGSKASASPSVGTTSTTASGVASAINTPIGRQPWLVPRIAPRSGYAAVPVGVSVLAPTASYRLIASAEILDYACRLPPTSTLTLILDSCYSVLPGVSPVSNFAPTFKKVDHGHVDYNKLKDFLSRPRFLELPVLPVSHTPPHLWSPRPFPACLLHCLSACRLQEWCSEFPIEGTVQGAFSWSFIKALARGHFHCGIYQFLRLQATALTDLKIHFKGVEQTPVLQLSQAAGTQDIVLWT